MTQTLKEYTPQQLLALPLEENDAGAATVGQYLIILAHKVWSEGEGFSGKRPFGNSGWHCDLWKTFIKHDVVRGEIDEEGDVASIDDWSFDSAMISIFAFLREADWNTLTLPVEPKDWYLVYLDVNGFGEPVISDYFYGGLTKKEAEVQASENNAPYDNDPWKAIQIPS